MKGPRPTPTALNTLRGNPGKRARNKGEPKPKGRLGERPPPADLPPQAVPFWTHAIAEAPMGVLTHLDQRLLFTWAIAAWLHSEAASNVSKSALIVRASPKAGPDGQQTTGALMQNPYLAIVNRQAGIMLKAAAEMGFTPSSRTRIDLGPNAPSPDNDDWGEFA